MIGSAMRLRAFRRANTMTQGDAAAHFGVDERTVRRWETGTALPLEVQKEIRRNGPLTDRLVEGVASVVRYSSGLMVLADEELVIIANSPKHKERMQSLFGIDLVGRSWLDFMTPEAKAWIEAEGGRHAMIDRGFLYSVVPYERRAQTLQGEVLFRGVTHHASIWVGSGTQLAILTITDLPESEALPAAPTVVYASHV